jgi:hypothetical protein
MRDDAIYLEMVSQPEYKLQIEYDADIWVRDGLA